MDARALGLRVDARVGDAASRPQTSEEPVGSPTVTFPVPDGVPRPARGDLDGDVGVAGGAIAGVDTTATVGIVVGLAVPAVAETRPRLDADIRRGVLRAPRPDVPVLAQAGVGVPRLTSAPRGVEAPLEGVGAFRGGTPPPGETCPVAVMAVPVGPGLASRVPPVKTPVTSRPTTPVAVGLAVALPKGRPFDEPRVGPAPVVEGAPKDTPGTDPATVVLDPTAVAVAIVATAVVPRPKPLIVIHF